MQAPHFESIFCVLLKVSEYVRADNIYMFESNLLLWISRHIKNQFYSLNNAGDAEFS